MDNNIFSKKKLLFIDGPLNAGGAEKVLIDLLNNLDYSKYEVDLCLFVNGGILTKQVPQQVNIFYIWPGYSFSYKLAYRLSIWLRCNYWLIKMVNKKIKKNYDFTISFLEGMPLKLHALLNLDAIKITWVHCDLYNFPYEKEVFAKGDDLLSYNVMDKVICVSNDTLLAFKKRFLNCTTPVSVIYNPVDLQKVERLAADPIYENKDEVFQVVCVGRLTPPKKMDRIIRLAAKMKAEKRKSKFSIVGDGELKSELVALSKTLDVEDSVQFLGFHSNPYPYMKNADLLLLPSGYEGFGLVVVEAMALGVPVVSTKTAGPTEIIGDNEYGILCEHDDEAIYQAVIKMMEHKELREEYSEKGKKRASDFDVKRMIEGFDELVVKTLRK